MKLSPAPIIYPSGLRPVAAAGAGGQFATDPIHGMRVTARDSLPATTMQNRYRVGGIQRCWAWIGTVGHVKDGHDNAGLGTEWHGQAWQHVTPRNGGNFRGCALQAKVGRAEASLSATRGDIAGQFTRLVSARRGRAGLSDARQQRELGAVSKRNFPGGTRRCQARKGQAVRGPAWLYATQSGIWDNFSRRGKPGPGRSRPGSARRGNNVTGDGNPGHFPKHQEALASRGATVQGMTGNV